MADAGWYPDPEDTGSIRYFDGAQWTEHRQPHAAPAAEETVARSHLPQPDADPTGQPGPYGQPGSYGQSESHGHSPAYGDTPGGYGTGAAAYSATEAYPASAASYPGAPPPGYVAPAGGAYSSYQPTGQLPAYPPTPPPKGKRNRTLLILGVVAVLLVAGGAIWYFLRPDKPKLTYQGKSIKDASQVLDTAAQNLTTVVKARHGATNGDTRCYFAVPKDEPSGAKSSDIDSRLRCGPVLFVDGDPDAPYLPFSLTATPAGGSVSLAVSSQPASTDPSPIGEFTLKRPDGKTPPSGSGGLKPPAPPAAEANTVTATDLGPVPVPATAPPTAIMGSYSVGVQLVRAGVVDRYGSGDDARSAPTGSKIVVFQLTARAGDIEDKSGDLFDDLRVVAGGSPISVPEPDSASQYLAAVVPSSSNPVLQLSDHDVTQTLSLPAGTPGSSNLQVLTRTHRKATNAKTFDTSFDLRQGSATGTETVHGSYTGAELDYWNPDVPTAHPSTPSGALLRVLLNYQNTDKPGTNYGFDPPLLTLKLPDGSVVPAGNIAQGDFIIDVFKVPANFTGGTISISGSHVVDGVTLTVNPAITLPVTIAAG